MALRFLKKLGFGKKKEDPFSRISRQLLEFSSAFSSVTDMKQLVPSVIGKIRELMNTHEIALFLLDRKSEQFVLAHSRGIDIRPRLRLRGDYYFTGEDKLLRWLMTNKTAFQMSKMPEVFSFFGEEEQDILRFVATELCIPLEAHNRIVGILCLGRRKDGGDFSGIARQLLAAIAAQAALAFENNRLQLEAVERVRVTRELEIAGELQKRLLPGVAPDGYPGLDITGFCIPSSEVGGDYFDYLKLSDRHLGLVIGDVAGHGMRAGLLMVMAKSCLATTVKIDASCSQVMNTLNALIYELPERHTLMTLLYSLYDVDERTLTFSNAGHIFPYHYSKRTDTLAAIESTSYPLGVRAHYQFPERSIRLEPGDFMLTCSDGFVESLNRKNEPFGYDRYEESVHFHRHKDASGLIKGIKNDLFEFLAGRPHQDDLTLVALKLKG